MRSAAPLIISILTLVPACSPHDAQPTAPPPVVPATGTLVIDISGLAGAPAQVLVSAPSGYRQTVTASTTLTRLDSALYAIDAATVYADDSVYGPLQSHSQVWVSGSVSPVVIAIAYAAAHGRPPLAPPVGSYVGAFASYGGSGTLVVELPTSGALATGSLAVTGGAIVPLSGTFSSDSSPQLRLAGGGYFINGLDTTGGRIAGNLSGPGGSGAFAVAAGGPTVKVFCGVISGQVTGAWNVVLDTTGRVSVLALSGKDMVGRYWPDSVPQMSVMSRGSTYYYYYSASGNFDLANGTGTGVYTTGLKRNIGTARPYAYTGTWNVSEWGC